MPERKLSDVFTGIGGSLKNKFGSLEFEDYSRKLKNWTAFSSILKIYRKSIKLKNSIDQWFLSLLLSLCLSLILTD